MDGKIEIPLHELPRVAPANSNLPSVSSTRPPITTLVGPSTLTSPRTGHEYCLRSLVRITELILCIDDDDQRHWSQVLLLSLTE